MSGSSYYTVTALTYGLGLNVTSSHLCFVHLCILILHQGKFPELHAPRFQSLRQHPGIVIDHLPGGLLPKEIKALWVIPCESPLEIFKLDSIPFRMRFQPRILGCVPAHVSIKEAANKPKYVRATGLEAAQEEPLHRGVRKRRHRRQTGTDRSASGEARLGGNILETHI